MVAGYGAENGLLKKVAEIYEWLDLQIYHNSDLAGKCDVCGRCCDFVNFDHHLFVTTPELMYLAANLGTAELKSMVTSWCPYNTDGKCAIYKYRFAGCRIFCCRADADFQSELSELAVKRFKSICKEFQISYCYIDLATALNTFAGD